MNKKLNIRKPGQKRILLGVAAGMVIICILALIPSFMTKKNLTNLILRSVPLLSLTIGQMMVLLTGCIDLSVGALMSVSTAIASEWMKIDLALGVGAAFLFALLLGAGNGLAVTKLKINPFLVTLGTSSIINGIALFIRPYPGGYIDQRFARFMLLSVNGFPLIPVLLFVFLAGIGIFLLKITLFGRHLYAVGGNFEASRLAGINADRIIITAYMLSGLFAAAGGLYMVARIGCGDPTVGKPFQMESITAAVLGGTALTGGKGSMTGTILGVILVVLLGNIFNLLNFNIYWQQVSRGCVLLVVVAVSHYNLKMKERMKLRKLMM